MTTKRRALAGDPLDGLVPEPAPKPQSKQKRAKPSRSAKQKRKRPSSKKPVSTPAPSTRRPKERATFHVPADLLEQARNAVYWLSGPPERLTLAGLVERALAVELKRLHDQHNKGEPFPERHEQLRGGRPVGS